VSWGAKILPLRVFSDFDGCSSANSAHIAQAIYYAVWAATASTHAGYTGRTVINISLGCQFHPAACPPTQVEQDAVKFALSQGVPVIAAKGNFGTSNLVYPSDYTGVFGVGATNSKDQLASFSNYGSSLAMVAPGTDILGAAAGGGYRDDDGTSFAAPQVAGAAALLFSALPAATTAQVLEILLASADDLGDPGRDDFFGAGRLNLFRAMRHARYGSQNAALETKPLVLA
jgi:subtilisin family serine protease